MTTFGDIYEGIEYPVHFVLAGSGCVGAWNVEDVDPSDVAKVSLTNELAVSASFIFTRITPSSPAIPLADSEVVSVEVLVTPSPATPLYWKQITSGDLDVIALTRQSAPGPGNRFVFSSAIRKCDVYINLRPDIAVLANSSETTLASLFTDPRSSLWAPSSADGLFHNIVWPVPSSPDLAPYRKLRIASAIGDWVWKPTPARK